MLADKLYSCVLTFGSSQVYTSKHYHTYDPALVDPLKEIGKYINITRKDINGGAIKPVNQGTIPFILYIIHNVLDSSEFL